MLSTRAVWRVLVDQPREVRRRIRRGHRLVVLIPSSM
jgi:hypothetical protein